MKSIKKVALTVSTLGVGVMSSALVMAQDPSARDAAVQAAVDSGSSTVTLVVGGIIAIAAIVCGVGIIIKLLAR